MIFTVSKGIREFCAAMVANPNDWEQGVCTFKNKKHPDIAVWTLNGFWFVAIGGNAGLTLAEKAYVLRAVKLTTARRLTWPNAGVTGAEPQAKAKRPR